eukprot:tig00000147_g9492.t1
MSAPVPPAAIVHAAEQRRPLSSQLSQRFRLRTANDIAADYIFPSSGSVAFQVTASDIDGVLARAVRLAAGFRMCFVIAVLLSETQDPYSPVQSAFMHLQLRFPHRPILIPVASEQAAAETILEVVAATTREKRAEARAAFEAQMAAHMPPPREAAQAALAALLPEQSALERALLLDGMGTLASVLTASPDELRDRTALDAAAALRIHSALNAAPFESELSG